MPSSDHSAADAAYDLQQTAWPENEGAASESVPSGFLPPSEVLGRYVVLYRLGTGGMGIVYAAYDPELDRKVALKLLRRISSDKVKRKRAQDRLLEEARAMARLTHPNVITVHDVALVGGRVVVAMEFIDGQTLSSTLMKGDNDWRKTIATMIHAGRGLAAAHEAGIVHRDFKPDNVMLAKDGRVVVMDFGLARALDVEMSSGGARSRVSMRDSDGFDNGIQRSGLRRISTDTRARPKTRIVGTPAYMAPEQHRGQPVDGRTDQFSFCVTLYEALYGHRPFQGEKPKDMLEQIESGRLPPPPSHTRVPSWVRAVIVRGLSVDPEDRFPSMEYLLRVLQDDPAIRRKRWLSLGSVVAAVGLGTTGAWALHNSSGAQCDGGLQRLDGVWDDSRRGEVEQAFRASGKPYAAASWEAVQSALDGYTERWLQMHRDVCEATHVRGEQSDELMDLRMECLGRRLSELEALTTVFADADASLVESGVSAIGKLVPVAVCADSDLLKAPIKPPDDPQLRIRIGEVRDQLARAKAHDDAGRVVRGVAIARAALERAEQIDYAPLQAEAYVQTGRLEMQSGMTDAAEESLRKAVLAAARGHHDEMAARAWVSLANTLGYMKGDYARAREILEAAEAAVERAGRPPELEAMLHQAVAVVLMHDNKLEEAEAEFEAALEAQRRGREGDFLSIGGSLNNLAAVQLMQGQFDEGARTLEEAIATEERMLGAEHPRVAVMLVNLTNVAIQEGDIERGQRSVERAISILERGELTRHPDYARALHQSGVIQSAAGDLKKAEEELRAATDIGRELLADHADFARTLMRLGQVLNELDKHDEAERVLEEGLRRAEQALGSEHPDVALCRAELAIARAGQGSLDEARALLQQSVPILEKSPAQIDDRARAQFAFAKVLQSMQPEQALEQAERARASYASLPAKHVLRSRGRVVQAWMDERRRGLEQ